MNSNWTVDMCWLILRDRDVVLMKVLPRLSKSVVLISAAVSGSRRSATGVLIMSLKCPKCGAEGASGINTRRSIFSLTQRVRKQVVVHVPVPDYQL